MYVCCEEQQESGCEIIFKDGSARLIGPNEFACEITFCPWCGTMLFEEKPEVRKADPAMLPPALFDLVPLCSLPESTWKGRGVFLAGTGQDGYDLSGCIWIADDLCGLEEGTAAYDVGVVDRWEPDPHFADLGIIRVFFVGSHGSRLHYPSHVLWTHVPKLRGDPI